MPLIAIACVAKDYGLGKVNKETGQGQLLFDIPADMKYFRNTTLGHICVFGYTTYLSLPKRPLKNRVNVVLWDKATSLDCLPGAITFSDFEQLLSFVKILAKEYKVYICGGASLYKLFLPYYDQIDLDVVRATDPDTTVFFPNLENTDFKLELCSKFEKTDDTNGYYISHQLWNK